MYRIHKVCSFEAAHRLPGHPKCGKLHGHSYKVEVTLEATRLDGRGFIVDFGEISKLIKQYDHSGVVIEQTAEQLAEEFAKQLSYIAPLADRIIVRVWETASAWAEYEVPRES